MDVITQLEENRLSCITVEGLIQFMYVLKQRLRFPEKEQFRAKAKSSTLLNCHCAAHLTDFELVGFHNLMKKLLKVVSFYCLLFSLSPSLYSFFRSPSILSTPILLPTTFTLAVFKSVSNQDPYVHALHSQITVITKTLLCQSWRPPYIKLESRFVSIHNNISNNKYHVSQSIGVIKISL